MSRQSCRSAACYPDETGLFLPIDISGNSSSFHRIYNNLVPIVHPAPHPSRISLTGTHYTIYMSCETLIQNAQVNGRRTYFCSYLLLYLLASLNEFVLSDSNQEYKA